MQRFDSKRRLNLSRERSTHMATTHNARRRQRTHRTISAHTRHANRVVGTRPDRAAAQPRTAPEPKVEVDVEVAPVKAVKPVRAPDADDHLAAYFRQLAEHELLSPEDER